MTTSKYTRLYRFLIITFFSCLILFINPLLALFVQLISICYYGVVRDRANITHPVYISSALCGFYFVFGSMNISSYRGDISLQTNLLSYFFVCFLTLGSLFLDLLPESKKNVDYIVPNYLLILSALPSVVGLLWIGVSPGFPLFHPNLFTAVRGKAFFLSETIFVTFVLVMNNIYIRKNVKLSYQQIITIFFMLFLISLPGYRGWPIIAILCITLLNIKYNPTKLVRLAILYGTSILSILSGLAYFRRLHSDNLVLAEVVIEKFDAEKLGVFGALLHFALRESIAISQSLIERYFERSHDIGKSLFLSDFMTMLPGKHESGGILIASLFAEYSGVGLTPGALGALIYEFGLFTTFSLTLLFGLILASFYRLSIKYSVPGYHCLYYLVLIYTVHYIHRGIPKPSYLINPILILIFLWITRLTNGRPLLRCFG